MSTHIEGVDVYGDRWSAECDEYAPDDPPLRASAVRIELSCPIEALSDENANRLGAFLLKAGGCDLVALASKIVGAHQRRLTAIESDPVDSAAFQAAINDRDDAIELLEAALKKVPA